jgi:hypothetical protein
MVLRVAPESFADRFPPEVGLQEPQSGDIAARSGALTEPAPGVIAPEITCGGKRRNPSIRVATFEPMVNAVCWRSRGSCSREVPYGQQCGSQDRLRTSNSQKNLLR